MKTYDFNDCRKLVVDLIKKVDDLIKVETDKGFTQKDRAWIIEGVVINMAANLALVTIPKPTDGRKTDVEYLLEQLPKRVTELNEQVFDKVVQLLEDMKRSPQ